MRVPVLLSLLWSLVDSQTVPYVSFRGETLPNHSYVDLSLVGDAEDGSDSVQCHTDLTSCCTSGLDGDDRPDWRFPNGNEVRFENEMGDIYQLRGAQRNDLRRRNNVLSPSGIYRCEIPTNDGDLVKETVYVGIYGSGGAVTISDGPRIDIISDLNGPSSEFTLTCISTGGPATTVTWTRGFVTVTEGNVTEFNTATAATIAQYTHTLTVSDKLGGLYTCTVANDRPSSDSADITIEDPPPPTNLKAEAGDDFTSILLTWTPSSGANGYIISYDNGAGSRDTVTVDDGSTDNRTLNGLMNGTTYNISIFATSTHFNSDSVLFNPVERVELVVPGQPSVSVTSITATSISLSWSVPSDSVVTSHEVMWRETDSGATEMTSGSLTDTSYTIEQLDSTTIYTITVTASNTAGNTDSLPVIISTGSDSYPAESCDCTETDNTAAIISGVVAVVLIMSITLAIIVIVVLVLRRHRGQYTTGPSKREAMSPPGATNTMELSKFSGEPTYIDPDVIPTSSNEAYHTVSQTGETTTDYETISDPHAVPPSTSHSSQPPTAGDYEQYK